VGSFENAEKAERLRTTLAQKGYPVRVQPLVAPGQGVRYRVRVGSFADRSAADQTAHHLTAQEQVPAIVAGKD
jgi:cell division protein FtsN